MVNLAELEKRIQAIEDRNTRVERDKQWETSWVRKLVLIVCTYVAIGLYLNAIHVQDPWLNAIVPSVGFFLSTLTLPIVKQYWMEKRKK